MSKFMKVCALLALVLIAAGVLLGEVSQFVHGGPVSLGELADSVTHGQSDSRLGEWGSNIINELDQVNYNINDKIMFDSDHEVLSGDVDRYALESSEDVHGLDIEVGGCVLTLKSSGDNMCYVEADNAGRFQAYVEGDTLYLKSLTSTNRWTKVGNRQITLYIPDAILWDEISIGLGAGRLEFGKLTAEEISLEVGAGQIVGELFCVGELNIDVGAGSVELADAQVRHLEADVSMGSLTYAGDITSEAELECSMGNIEMDLVGTEKDYDYELQGTMGGLIVGGQDYSGLGNRKVQDNGAAKRIAAECSMGNIEIRFRD
ncbi:MAG: hypothetical protein J1E64_02460 [Acetatifactor sp.]|nr:hypothetical protein [Acetatifactor sp.]